VNILWEARQVNDEMLFGDDGSDYGRSFYQSRCPSGKIRLRQGICIVLKGITIITDHTRAHIVVVPTTGLALIVVTSFYQYSPSSILTISFFWNNHLLFGYYIYHQLP
jgi:hypothetical protein